MIQGDAAEDPLGLLDGRLGRYARKQLQGSQNGPDVAILTLLKQMHSRRVEPTVTAQPVPA